MDAIQLENLILTSILHLKQRLILKSIFLNSIMRSPGVYVYNSLLGCYRIQNEPGLPYADAKQECVNDGGRLLLVNSAAEATELASLLSKNYSFLLVSLSLNSS